MSDELRQLRELVVEQGRISAAQQKSIAAHEESLAKQQQINAALAQQINLLQIQSNSSVRIGAANRLINRIENTWAL